MNCIIIEDEIPAQRILKAYIAKLPDLDLVGSFQTVFEANPYLQKNKVDLLFLDINLPEISGIQYIKTLPSPPSIIMTTAYHEHAVESFELDTICDYLVKPFSLDRFLKAVNKAKSRMDTPVRTEISPPITEVSFFLNIDKTLHKVFLKDIVYIESDKNYVTVVTTKARLAYIDALRNWLEKLPQDRFIQVHKSYIVNFDYIEKIQGNQLSVRGETLPIGRVFKPKLLEWISYE